MLYSSVSLICNVVGTSGQYVFESKGSGSCSNGEALTSTKSCHEACSTLNLPEKGKFEDGMPCYKDYQGNCYQNGLQGDGASLICNVSNQN